MKDHAEEHANDLHKSNYVQEVLQAKRKHQEGQGLSLPDLHSKSNNFVTLVTKLIGELGLILCLFLLVQEASFSIKEVSSHLEVICPLKSASKVKLYSLPSWARMKPGKRLILVTL